MQPLNMDFVKQRLNQLTNKNKSNKPRITWQPKVGSHQIRIVPNTNKEDFPFVELYFYYKFGPRKRTLLSPVSFDKPDPIMEFAQQLKDEGEWKQSFAFQPKLRVFVPIIVRNAENEGVKWWSISEQQYTSLLELINDPDYGNICDTKEGHDLTVTIKEIPGKQYHDTTVTPKPKPSVVTTSKETIELIKNQSNIMEQFDELTYEELQTELENHIKALANPDDPNANITSKANIDQTPTSNLDDILSDKGELDLYLETPEPEKPKASTKLEATTVNQLDQELDDIFNSSK